MTRNIAVEFDRESKPNQERQFNRLEAFGFLVAMIGVQLGSELFAQWGTYFYSPTAGTGRVVYVLIQQVFVIFAVGTLVDAVTDPLIGVWSDRTAAVSRWRWLRPSGRRRPFLFFGSLGMTITGILFWHPPVGHASIWNLAYGTLLLSAHWVMFTLAYVPLLALAPEIARSEAERVRLGTWIALGMTIGLALAAIAPGELIGWFDTARSNDNPAGPASAVGYQRVAALFAVVAMLCFQFLVWTVRERYDHPGEAAARADASAGQGPWRILFEPLFAWYLAIFFFFYVGVLAVQRASPYWVELALEGDESTVARLGIPFLLGCLGAIGLCPVLSRWLGLKGVMVLAIAIVALTLPLQLVVSVASWSPATRFALAIGLYGAMGGAIGMVYVLQTPLLGELIDRCAERTGVRREGAFNAMHALMVKGSTIASIGLMTLCMSVGGHSVDAPLGVYGVGPAGAACCWLALALAVRYPVFRSGGAELDKRAG